MSSLRITAALVLGAAATGAQAPQPATVVPPAAEQIALAVMPLPKDLRDGATVLGYAPDRRLVTLRKGSGSMICLANNPELGRFHVACYHESLEPFMARGRELRAQGVKGTEVDTVRFREVRQGTLRMPAEPALLYSLTGQPGTRAQIDSATGTVPGTTPLFVVYIPNATPASTGLSPVPARGTPWIMFPGTPKAHIMFTPSMSP